MAKPTGTTLFESAMHKGLVDWERNELFGFITINIRDVYPKNTADVIRILKDLTKEEEKKG